MTSNRDNYFSREGNVDVTGKNWKLIADPFFGKDPKKIYRFDGVVPFDFSYPEVILRDPRTLQYKNKITHLPIELPVPMYKVESPPSANYCQSKPLYDRYEIENLPAEVKKKLIITMEDDCKTVIKSGLMEEMSTVAFKTFDEWWEKAERQSKSTSVTNEEFKSEKPAPTLDNTLKGKTEGLETLTENGFGLGIQATIPKIKMSSIDTSDALDFTKENSKPLKKRRKLIQLETDLQAQSNTKNQQKLRLEKELFQFSKARGMINEGFANDDDKNSELEKIHALNVLKKSEVKREIIYGSGTTIKKESPGENVDGKATTLNIFEDNNENKLFGIENDNNILVTKGIDKDNSVKPGAWTKPQKRFTEIPKPEPKIDSEVHEDSNASCVKKLSGIKVHSRKKKPLLRPANFLKTLLKEKRVKPKKKRIEPEDNSSK